MQLPRPDLFISATSADLGPMRALVAQAILDLGAHPVEQTHFPPAGRTVADMIREKVAASRAVIHIVGHCYGTEDETATAAREHRSYEEGRRSYTQFEHDIALELGKPCYVFLCGKSFPYADHAPESQEQRDLQAEHRARLAGGAHLHYDVEHPGQLREKILLLEERINSLGEELRATRRNHVLFMGASVALILAVGIGLWWVRDRGEQVAQHAQQQSMRLAEQQAELEKLKLQSAEQMELVRAVLAKVDGAPASLREGGASDAIAAAQLTVAKERELTLDELRRRLAVAETAAEERVKLAEEIEKRASEDLESARRARRNAQFELGEAALANLKYSEAIAHFRSAVVLYDPETEPLGWMNAHARLANALAHHGEFDEAADTWRGLLTKMEKRGSQTHEQNIAIALNNLAVSYHENGRLAEAESMLRQTLETYEKRFGPEAQDTLKCLSNLGHVLLDKRDYDAAEPLILRTLKARELTLGTEHPDTLSSLNDLAELYVQSGDFESAEPLYRRTLATKEKVLGPKNPNTLVTINNLARLLAAREKFPEAQSLFQQALADLEVSPGPNHPITLSVVQNLAGLLRRTGDVVEAETLYRRLLAAREVKFGPEAAPTLVIAGILGELLDEKRDYPGAEQFLRRTASGREKLLGSDHPDSISAIYDLAFFLAKRGERDEAKRLARQAYEGRLKHLTPDDPRVQSARKLMESLEAGSSETP